MKKLFILFAVLFISACTTTKNISPPPTMIPASLSMAETEYSIMSVLKNAPKETNTGIAITEKILGAVFGVKNNIGFMKAEVRA